MRGAPRRALPDLEGGKSFWLFRLHRYARHRRQPGTTAGPVDQVLYVFGRSLEDSLDPAVGKIAYPACDPVRHGQPTARVSEEDTLDTAGDEHPVADHDTDVTGAQPGGPA